MPTIAGLKRRLFPPPDLKPVPADWDDPFNTLRKKWKEIPATAQGREESRDLLALSDEALVAYWQECLSDNAVGPGWEIRGWYQELYRDFVRGKKVMDVGSGLGMDSITFLQAGASHMTFVDLVDTNLEVLKRLCGIFGFTNVTFAQLTNLEALKPLPTDYDVIMAMGSLHNAPQSVMKPEVQELARHLRVGGRWLQFTYPVARWEREGSPPFEVWGQITDGPGTPWCEPYDVPKLLALLTPARFDVVFYHEFHNQDFNWFDLLYKGND